MPSEFPKLESKLEEILWECQKIVQKFREEKIEDVEIILNTLNFTKRSPIDKITYSLRHSLEVCFPNGNISRNAIKEEHVSIAQGLIKFGKYQNTALEVLAEALESEDSTVQKAAIQAISDCGLEIDAVNKESNDASSFFDSPFLEDGQCYVWRYDAHSKEHEKVPVDRSFCR